MQCHVMQLVWCYVMYVCVCVCILFVVVDVRARTLVYWHVCVCALCLFEETVQIIRSNRTEITIGTISTLSSNGAQYEYFIHRICVWMRMKWAKIKASYVIVKNSHIFRLNCPIQTNARNNNTNNIQWSCESANANISENCVWIFHSDITTHAHFNLNSISL